MKKPLFILSVVLLTATLLFSCYQLWRHFTVEKDTEKQFNRFTDQIEQPPPLLPPEWTVYDQYGALFEENPDTIGWIAIEGTTINYPVMQTSDRPNFYLKHNFEKHKY